MAARLTHTSIFINFSDGFESDGDGGAPYPWKVRVGILM